MTRGKVLSVEMMQDFVDVPFKFLVRKVAKTGRGSHNDKTTRDWWDGTRVHREAVPDYALVDVHQTMGLYKEYIRKSVLGDGCQPAIEKVVQEIRETSTSKGTDIVGDVYEQAWAYFLSLPSANEAWAFFYQPPPTKKTEKEERPKPVSENEFLLGFFELRFALSKLLPSSSNIQMS